MDLLDRFLDVVNENAEGPIWDASKRAQFDGRSKFMVAYGCPKCSPVTAMTVVDIPSGQDDARLDNQGRVGPRDENAEFLP